MRTGRFSLDFFRPANRCGLPQTTFNAAEHRDECFDSQSHPDSSVSRLISVRQLKCFRVSPRLVASAQKRIRFLKQILERSREKKNPDIYLSKKKKKPITTKEPQLFAPSSAAYIGSRQVDNIPNLQHEITAITRAK